jgi:hypothetical protein
MHPDRDEAFAGRRALRYLGVYRPIQACSLGNDFILTPHLQAREQLDRSMGVPLHTSYFLSREPKPDIEIEVAFRDWLIFDAFVLNDIWPIICFEDRAAGTWQTIPRTQSADCSTDRAKDYSDISDTIYFPPDLRHGRTSCWRCSRV